MRYHPRVVLAAYSYAPVVTGQTSSGTASAMSGELLTGGADGEGTGAGVRDLLLAVPRPDVAR
jgi:hypothetical protein